MNIVSQLKGDEGPTHSVLVVKATLELAGGQSATKSVCESHFNFIIMTSYQPSLDVSVYLSVVNG